MSEPGFQIGEFRVLPDRGELVRGNEVRRLEPRVMDVLVALVRHKGEVVSRDTLIEEVWRGVIVADDVISRCVYQLRKELGDSDRSMIQTVPKKGYRLTVAVERIEEQPGQAPPKGERRGAMLAVAAVVVIAVAIIVWRLTIPDDSDELTGDLPYTIAVLPFEEGEVTHPGYLGPGFAANLLHSLGRNPSLRVLARSTSFLYGERPGGQSGEEKLVLIEGTISDEGGTWTVDVRLVDSATGALIWQTRLATDTVTPTDLQQQIELGVMQALNAMPEGLLMPGSEFASDDLDAYRLVLAGRELIQTRKPEMIARAEAVFAEAAALDPDYAAAYSSLAEVYTHLTVYAGRDWLTLRDSARGAIQRALELSPDFAHAHAVQGLVHHYDGELELAIPSLKKAIELNPGFAEAHMWLGRVYQQFGRFDDAISAFETSALLSPLSGTPHINLAMANSGKGRFDEALHHYERTKELDPDNGQAYWGTGYVKWLQGDLSAALENFEIAHDMVTVNADFFAQFALVYIETGRLAEGTLHARQSIEMGPNRVWPNRAIAAAYLVNNDPDGLVREAEAMKNRYQTPFSQMELAKAYTLAGRSEDALQLYETRYLSREPWFHHRFDVTFGFSHVLLFAWLRKQGGKEFSSLLTAFAERVDDVAINQPFGEAGVAYARASIEAINGDHVAAMGYLRRAVDKGWTRWWWFDADPVWNDLRDNPDVAGEIAALRERTQIPPAS